MLDTDYMPMPDHCGRGTQPIIDGIKSVNLRICQDYCTENGDCGDYQAYRIIRGLDR